MNFIQTMRADLGESFFFPTYFCQKEEKMEGLHEDIVDEALPIELFEEFEPRIEERQQTEDKYPWD